MATNTLKSWVDHYGLDAELHGTRNFVRPSVLARFLAEHPHLRATEKALRRLEYPDTTEDHASGSAQEHADAGGRTQEQAARDRLRALQAQVATLDQRLAEAEDEIARLTTARDYWQDRARAHRSSMRELLDLEDADDREGRPG